MDAYDYKFPELHERYRATLKVGAVWYKYRGEVSVGEKRKKTIVTIDFTLWKIETDDGKVYDLVPFLQDYVPMFDSTARPVSVSIDVEMLKIPIGDIKLRNRTLNIIRRAGLETLLDVIEKGECEMLKQRDCGRISILDMKNAIVTIGGEEALKRFTNKR